MRDHNVAQLSSPSAPHDPADAQADGLDLPLVLQIAERDHRLIIGAHFLRSLAEGFREWKMPGRAAACENMANLLEDV